MTTTPTQLPVPSEKPQDLKFNAGKIDEFVTSMNWTYTDRFGSKHYTIEGINYLAQQVMEAFGYVTLTGLTFTTGATITSPNEVLFNSADNSYYKWTDSFASGPKIVPENSTPESTGGIGPGKWLSVGDTVLRNDLKSDTGGSFVSHKFAPSALSRTIADALNDHGIPITAFGADSTGVTPCDDAITSAYLFSKSLQFPQNGTFLITRPIPFYSQGSIYSPVSQGPHNDNRRCTIYAKRNAPGDSTTWQAGVNRAMLEPVADSTQAFILSGIAIEGWANIDYANLSASENTLVHGIDTKGCKESVKIIQCGFKRVSTGIMTSDSTKYTDTVYLDNVHFNLCYKVADLRPTVGIVYNGLYIFDCYKWVTTSRIAGVGLVCNNSSYATNTTQIEADSIQANGFWFEGGNRWFKTSSLEISSGYLSEAMSDSPTGRFIVESLLEADGITASQQSLIISGARMPTNTRFITLSGTANKLQMLNVTIKGCRNVGGSFGQTTPLSDFISSGMQYLGQGNSLRNTTTSELYNQSTLSKRVGYRKERVAGSRVNTSLAFNVEFDLIILSSISSTVQPEYIKLSYVGHNDGTGGTAVYQTDIKLCKGAGNNWVATSSNTAIATVSVTPSTTLVGCTVTITPVHEGNKANDALFVEFCSANLKTSLEA